MGEYAKRISDGQLIKVGACGAMYYCRWEQVDEITDYDFSIDDCMWRIPLPSEDGTQPGDYEYGGLLDKKYGLVPYDLMLKSDMFSDEMKESLLKSEGIVQSYVDKLGMLINVPCYHGIKLPDVGDSGIKVFWNGKKNPLHLCFLNNTDEELLVGIMCAGCNHIWTTSFDEIEPYIVSVEMKMRLFKQCSEYWCNRNRVECPYSVNGTHNKKPLKMRMTEYRNYEVVLENLVVSKTPSFDECKEIFMNMMDNE